MSVSTQQIISTCQQERSAYRSQGQSSSPACVELFRRAFAADQIAWAAVQQNFEPLMRSWVGVQNQLEPEDVVQEAFLAFYRYASDRPTLVATDQLGPVLEYLRQCTKTALLMLLRKIREPHPPESVDSIINLTSSETSLQRSDLRLALQERLDKLLSSDKERLVFHLRFVCNTKPQEIFEEHRDTFQEYKEVATIIQRLTRRLRKDEIIQDLHRPRQKLEQSASLMMSMLNDNQDLGTQKGNPPMENQCQFDEVVLLDYVTGIAAAEVVGAIEQSPACVLAAKQLAQEIGPLLPILHRLTCPDVETLVTHQQRQLGGTEQLILHRHIEQCPLCQEEVAMLVAVDKVELEPQNEPGLVRRLVEAILQSPLTAPQPIRGTVLHYQTPQIFINLSMRRNPVQQRTWRISGQLRTPDGMIYREVEEITLLEKVSESRPSHQASITERGTFVFSDLHSGVYKLRVLTDEEEIIIREIFVGDDG